MRVDEVRCDFCDGLIDRKHRSDSTFWLGHTNSKYSITVESPRTRIKEIDLCSKCYDKVVKGLTKLGYKKEKEEAQTSSLCPQPRREPMEDIKDDIALMKSAIGHGIKTLNSYKSKRKRTKNKLKGGCRTKER